MNKEILRLAIPNIISNLSVPLLGTVDTLLMGRQESPEYLGAIALGGIIFNVIYWSMGFLRMGTTGMTAQAFGRKDQTAISQVFGRAMVVALGVSLLLVALQFVIADLSFEVLHASAEVEVLAREYFLIRIWAAPAAIGLLVLMGWFFGMQNAIYPMMLTILINVVNIGFSFLFVHHFGMKAEGVALGTVVAQYVGFVGALLLFLVKYRSYLKGLSMKALMEIEGLKRFFLINRDIFIRTALLVFVFSFFTDRSATQGDLILAINAILLQYFYWLSYGVDGFAFAAESLIGKYKGANDLQQLKRGIRLCFVWGMGLAFSFMVVYWLGGVFLLGVFTKQTAVIEGAKPYLIWLILMPILATPSFIWDGIFIGLTASKAMRDSMLASVLVFMGCYFWLTPNYGNHGLWLSMCLFMVVRWIIQSVWWFRGK